MLALYSNCWNQIIIVVNATLASKQETNIAFLQKDLIKINNI